VVAASTSETPLVRRRRGRSVTFLARLNHAQAETELGFLIGVGGDVLFAQFERERRNVPEGEERDEGGD
jgi:hypothetical protein